MNGIRVRGCIKDLGISNTASMYFCHVLKVCLTTETILSVALVSLTVLNTDHSFNRNSVSPHVLNDFFNVAENLVAGNTRQSRELTAVAELRIRGR